MQSKIKTITSYLIAQRKIPNRQRTKIPIRPQTHHSDDVPFSARPKRRSNPAKRRWANPMPAEIGRGGEASGADGGGGSRKVEPVTGAQSAGGVRRRRRP